MTKDNEKVEELSKLELVSGGEVTAAIESFKQSLPHNPPGYPVAVYKEVSSDYMSNSLEFMYY